MLYFSIIWFCRFMAAAPVISFIGNRINNIFGMGSSRNLIIGEVIFTSSTCHGLCIRLQGKKL